MYLLEENAFVQIYYVLLYSTVNCSNMYLVEGCTMEEALYVAFAPIHLTCMRKREEHGQHGHILCTETFRICVGGEASQVPKEAGELVRIRRREKARLPSKITESDLKEHRKCRVVC